VLVSPTRSPGITIDYPGQLDWRVLALSVAVCIGSTMLFALVPAIQASHVDLSGALKNEGGGLVGGSGRSRVRSVLVFVQVALSFVLIVGTGLLLRSLVQMQNSDPGFSTRNVVVSSADLFSNGYKPDRAKIFYEQMLERIRALPGVQSVALEGVRPFSYADYSSAPLEIEGYQPPRNEQVSADYNQVSEGYFATIGIPIVSGREFTRNDDENAPSVAIVNETMAGKYWLGKDAVGQRLKVKDKWMEVVGVAKNAHYRTKLEQPTPFFYVPVRQNFLVQNGFIIRTDQSAVAIMNALAREIHVLDPNLAPLDTISLQEQVDRMSYTQRLAAALLGIFGGMALFLASIGLYAVMSYSVSQGARELGMRMALGADTRDVVRLVISRGLRLTTAGIVIGAIAALMLTRLMDNLLYKVSPRDPMAFGIAFVIMTTVALIACFLPAWRATRIDPAQVLRDQ
jgi:putative ABC transport system permease protein